MQKRRLGKTNLTVSCLGFGGFHLLEIPQVEASKLLNAYLDKGGNYIETAAGYGNGESERKIGQVLQSRRAECVLTSKTHGRDGASCRKTVEQSLINLQTDHLDILLMHAVGTIQELDTILSENGAFNEALKLKEEGKINHIGISMHGQPDVLIEALHRAPFDVVMTTINYYDVNNFPKLLGELVPLANKLDVGIILMKPLADGLLWKNAEMAFNYALSQAASIVVTGMNSMEMLEKDITIANNFKQLTAQELLEIKAIAPELGNYVCRQCGACDGLCPTDIQFRELFLLEGLYDRQMKSRNMNDTADFALRERLRFWFNAQEKARTQYATFSPQGNACTHCGQCEHKCPYGINIEEKVSLADYKLGARKNY